MLFGSPYLSTKRPPMSTDFCPPTSLLTKLLSLIISASLHTLAPATLPSLNMTGCFMIACQPRLYVNAAPVASLLTSPLVKPSLSFKVLHTCLPLQEVFLDHPHRTICSHSPVGRERRERMEKVHAGHLAGLRRFGKERLQRGVGDLSVCVEGCFCGLSRCV